MQVRTDFRAGAVAVAPILLGIVPFGVVTGVAAIEAGIPAIQAAAMSVFVFAGASQLAAIDLIGRSAPVLVVVAAVFVVNLRMAMYSASIAPNFRGFSRPWRWFCAYFLTDQAYAVSITEYAETTPEERSRKWYYLGAATTLWVCWQASTLAGILLGASVPDGLSLDFAAPLTFMALLFPALKNRKQELAAGVAALVSVFALGLPFDLGLVLGAVAGIVAGAALEWRQQV